MPRILIGGKLHPSGLDLLYGAAGYNIDYVEEISTESLAPKIFDADALLVRTQLLPGSFIEKSKNLKVVSRHGVGYDAVDVAALNKRSIPLAIVGDVNSRTVAEHAMMLMLATGKRLLRMDASSRGEGWEYRNAFESRELYAKTLLIIGYGRIGRHLAKLAQGFGMRVMVHDPYLRPKDLSASDVEPCPDLLLALSRADYVSVHTPKSDGPVLGAVELGAMKSTSIVINTARGGVVDEAALANALNSGSLAGAGLDVFEEEPPAKGHFLANAKNTVLTPHAAGLTLECAERMAVSSARNILDFFAGKLDAALVVNRAEIGYGRECVTG
ncbi:hydroxyacid dehydrogenase [Pelagibius sp. Alg239-R121]|uniref:hydroxyacid dehydrogenase n=1 Tax=Pelagibius sp. Alg239-R121 TaxID=2993448 RepID=UPI0024A61BA1|nr:hydroxyacid dehydrogenase [Pelagibius sp. Alg239-R121]